MKSDTKPDRVSGALEVGITTDGEVVVNHPALVTDETGCGHIVFSVRQARAFAKLLYKKADEAEEELKK